MEAAPEVKARLPFKTVREYYEDSYRVSHSSSFIQYTSNAKVLDMWKTDKENEFAVILDKTIFHP
jgi:hypothetical protein